MNPGKRIGALELSELISEKIGSFVYHEFLEFRAIDGDKIHLWYSNSGGKGPSVEITLQRDAQGDWNVDLKELPPGTVSSIDQP